MEIVLSHHLTIAAILAQLPKVSQRARLAVVCRAWAAAVRESAEIWRDLHPTLKLRHIGELCAGSSLTEIQRVVVLLDVPRDVGPMERACVFGRLDVAEWLADRYGFTRDDLEWTTNPHEIVLLNQVCEGGSLDVIKWVITRFDVTVKNLLASRCIEGYHAVCDHNPLERHLHALEWVVSHFDRQQGDDTVEWRRGLSSWAEDSFYSACADGNIELLWWMRRRGLVPAQVHDPYELMCEACWRGHTTVAQFLIAAEIVTPAMMDAWAPLPLSHACQRGHLETARWLAAEFPTRREHVVTGINEEWSVVTAACVGGCLETLQWLVSHYGIRAEDLLADRDCEPLLFAVPYHDKNHVVKWLMSTFDLSSKRAHLEVVARTHCNIDLVEWLNED
jgi:hypothetical protein